jgi:hypothetical protein
MPYIESKNREAIIMINHLVLGEMRKLSEFEMDRKMRFKETYKLYCKTAKRKINAQPKR